MNDTGWDKIVDAIDAKFGVDRHGKKTEPLEDRPDLTQHVSFIEFEKGGQVYRFERIAHPSIIDRKSHFHKTAGSGVRFENIYDPSETSYKTQLLKKDGDEWVEASPEEMAL
jgi:hypothetical protein